MNVFTPCTINHVQQQPVDDFVPRANLKRFFKDDAISTGDSEAKEAASRYFCCTCLSISDMHVKELQVLPAIREKSGLYSFDSGFWGGGGGQ